MIVYRVYRVYSNTSVSSSIAVFSCVQAGREEWMRLRHELMPLLKQGPIIFLAQARQLLPRQLLSQPAATEYQATENVSVCVGRGPEAADDAVDAASDSGEENSAEVIQLAKEKVKETREADGEEVDFDDLDILDELEEAAAAIRKERREQRRRRRAAREAWIREAKIEAKRKEALDVSGASVKPASIHERPPWLWKQLATDAFKSGNYYQAQFYYTREAESYGLEPFTASIIHDKVMVNKRSPIAMARISRVSRVSWLQLYQIGPIALLVWVTLKHLWQMLGELQRFVQTGQELGAVWEQRQQLVLRRLVTHGAGLCKSILAAITWRAWKKPVDGHRKVLARNRAMRLCEHGTGMEL